MVKAQGYRFNWKFGKAGMMAPVSGNMGFAADRMLGRLAKWLRVLGQDVIYGPHLSGNGLVRAARSQQRVILTRDRRLRKLQPAEFIFIKSDHYQEQLRQVILQCGLEIGRALFTRCLACNSVLQPKSKVSVKAVVPPYVFSNQENFFSCARCKRIYWPATHHHKMLDELQKMGVLQARI